MTNILKINASARVDGSVSRQLSNAVIDQLKDNKSGVSIVERDLAGGLPFVSEEWIGANFTDEAERTDQQKAVLALSDELIAELDAADILVIGTPIYNFGVPAALKAWIDMICRARKTFRYSENGPIGLLEGKRAIITIATGGTEVGSSIDYASGFLRHIMGFVGINDVKIIAADRLMGDAAQSVEKAKTAIEALRC